MFFSLLHPPLDCISALQVICSKGSASCVVHGSETASDAGGCVRDVHHTGWLIADGRRPAIMHVHLYND